MDLGWVEKNQVKEEWIRYIKLSKDVSSLNWMDIKLRKDESIWVRYIKLG